MRKIFYTCAVVIVLFLLALDITNITYNVGYLSGSSYKQSIKSDIEYKKQIIKQSKLPELSVDDLASIVGPYELEEFIAKNSNNPQIYTPSKENIAKGVFQANLHSHTVNSDGKLTVQEMLDLANEYAKTISPKPFYLAVTDHNTLVSGKEIIEILDNNAEKYKNLKIIIGMEVFSVLEPIEDILNREMEIHLVSLAINPYDNLLNKVFYIREFVHNNYSYRTLEHAIILLNKKGLVGIAHPARGVYPNKVKSYKRYVDYLYGKYKYLTRKSFSFSEAYYQSYGREKQEVIDYIINNSDTFGVKKSGSIDNHGKNLFKKK